MIMYSRYDHNASLIFEEDVAWWGDIQHNATVLNDLHHFIFIVSLITWIEDFGIL